MRGLGHGVRLKTALALVVAWIALSGLLFVWFDGLLVLALLLGGVATTALFAAYRN